MSKLTAAKLAEDLNSLSENDLAELARYLEFLKWRGTQPAAAAPTHWSYDFVEHFPASDRSAERDPAGMEIRVSEASCGGVKRLSLWEHPPLSGAAHVAYAVPIPSEQRRLTLRFFVGIRDGAELPADRFVAFRVLVNGWKLWSVVKNSHAWEEYQVKMPELSSNVARVEFVTDGLGDHRWNWAVWGEPKLISDF